MCHPWHFWQIFERFQNFALFGRMLAAETGSLNANPTIRDYRQGKASPHRRSPL